MNVNPILEIVPWPDPPSDPPPEPQLPEPIYSPLRPLWIPNLQHWLRAPRTQRAGLTKNKGQGLSKARRKMAAKSRRINRVK